MILLNYISPLLLQGVQEIDYRRAQMIWKSGNCYNFDDYHDIYLKSDVLILADFFEKFREICMNSYGLEAVHYMSSPGIAWHAMLKMTKVEMELFQCPLMHDFIEKGIRGGVSTISHRLAKSIQRHIIPMRKQNILFTWI